jgi:hypothetical protein
MKDTYHAGRTVSIAQPAHLALGDIQGNLSRLRIPGERLVGTEGRTDRATATVIRILFYGDYLLCDLLAHGDLL